MNTLQKKKLRGTGVNCGLIVLLFAVVLLLGQVLPDNTYRRVLVPIIWQMCIFILLGTSLNLTLGYLGQLTLGHMGFAGIGAYTAALSSLALERAGVFEASIVPEGKEHFHFDVPVCVSDQFYGWVCGFGGKIEVVSPAEVRDGLRALNERLVKMHQ